MCSAIFDYKGSKEGSSTQARQRGKKLLSFDRRGEKLLFGKFVLDHGFDQWF
jgi:hypothetical protein